MTDLNQSMGELSSLTIKLLRRIMQWMDGSDLLRFSETCKYAFAMTCNDAMWKTRCLKSKKEGGLVVDKLGDFEFKVCWKYTFLRPQRLKKGQRQPPTRYFIPGTGCLIPRGKNAQYYSNKELDFEKIPIRGKQVPTIPPLDISSFFNEYDTTGTPVVISGAAEAFGWKDLSASSLLSKYKNTIFKTNGCTEDGRTLRMHLRDYFNYCKDIFGSGEKPLYLFDNKFDERADDLRHQYCIPPYFAGDLFEEMTSKDRPDYKWLLIGPKSSGAPFHTDPHQTHAWNMVTEGKKRIAFYPPNVIPPGVDPKLIHTEYYAAEDTMNWYLDIYPTLSEERLPLECVVNTGDMVFIPSGWWHQVVNLSPITIAVTQNVCTRGNFSRVWRDLQTRGPQSLARKFKAAVEPGNPSLFKNYARPCDMSDTASSSSDSSSTSDSSSDSSDL